MFLLCSTVKKPIDYEIVSNVKPQDQYSQPEKLHEESSKIEIPCSNAVENEIFPKWHSTQLEMSPDRSQISSNSSENLSETNSVLLNSTYNQRINYLKDKTGMIKESTRLLVKSGYYSSSDFDLTNNQNSFNGMSTIDNRQADFLFSTAVPYSTFSHRLIYESIDPKNMDLSILSSCSSSSFENSTSISASYESSGSSFDKGDDEQEFLNIYICSTSYRSKYMGDLNINEYDKVEIIHERGHGYILVKLLTDGRVGYVPKACLTPLHQFRC